MKDGSLPTRYARAGNRWRYTAPEPIFVQDLPIYISSTLSFLSKAPAKCAIDAPIGAY